VTTRVAVAADVGVSVGIGVATDVGTTTRVGVSINNEVGVELQPMSAMPASPIKNNRSGDMDSPLFGLSYAIAGKKAKCLAP
jgi:hypothetical protein